MFDVGVLALVAISLQDRAVVVAVVVMVAVAAGVPGLRFHLSKADSQDGRLPPLGVDVVGARPGGVRHFYELAHSVGLVGTVHEVHLPQGLGV